MPAEQTVVKHNATLPERESLADKIAAILLRRNMIDMPTLQQARAGAQADGKRLEECLVNRKIVSDTDMTLVLAEYLAIPPMTLIHFIPDSQLLDLIPKEVRAKLVAIPIAKVGKTLTVAVGDPFNISTLDEIQTMTGLNVVAVVAAEREVKEVLQKFTEKAAPGLEDMFKNMMESEDVEVGHEKKEEISLDQMLESAEGAPVIRIVNSIMVEAMRRRASDIHIEPMEKAIRLRYRVDGDLYEVPSPPKNLQSAIISRIKIMSDMDIAERRIPQDGRFKIKAMGKEVDVRVSLLPMIHGEKIVMRILDKTKALVKLEDSGMDSESYQKLIKGLQSPFGIILVTGPTGSGKTTTLYGALNELRNVEDKVITVEDPVEYRMNLIQQVQVNPKVGLSFADALRSILRQDPDKIMIGEIRDHETLEIAIKAALTGHLVISTLHTNDAISAIPRMSDMGIEPYLISGALVAIQAQRLVRRICNHCKKEIDIPQTLLQEYSAMIPPHTVFYEGVGCKECNGSGYMGREMICEVLPITEEISSMIARGASKDDLLKEAKREGFIGMFENGMAKAVHGITTFDEILRVAKG